MGLATVIIRGDGTIEPTDHVVEPMLQTSS